MRVLAGIIPMLVAGVAAAGIPSTGRPHRGCSVRPRKDNGPGGGKASFRAYSTGRCSTVYASSTTISGPVPTGSGVPLGAAIPRCTVPGTAALTFDDDPFIYTNQTLDFWKRQASGNTWGDIDDCRQVIRPMAAAGHQVASHTYDYSVLLTLNDAEIIETMILLEEKLIDILGKYAVYMRPPAFQYDNATLELLGALGYHVIDADLDTLDYLYTTLGDTTSLEILDEGLRAGNTIILAHVALQNTAEVLLPNYNRLIQESGLRLVTVGECLGDPKKNWYKRKRTSNPTSTGTPSVISITSTTTPTDEIEADGLCGGANSYVCTPGTCCSQFGVCGLARFHCLSGCQSAYGVCVVELRSDAGCD